MSDMFKLGHAGHLAFKTETFLTCNCQNYFQMNSLAPKIKFEHCANPGKDAISCYLTVVYSPLGQFKPMIH